MDAGLTTVPVLPSFNENINILYSYPVRWHHDPTEKFVSIDINQPTLLITRQPPQPSPLKTLGCCILKPIAACIKKLSPILFFSMSVFASLPSILYSLTYLSNTQPKDINLHWWDSLSNNIKIFSCISSFATLIYNLLANEKLLPDAWHSLIKNLRQMFKSIPNFIKNIIFLNMALSAAVVAGATAFNALVWTYEFVSTASGLTNFLVYAARRYDGIVKAYDKLRNWFNSDESFKSALVAQLYYLKPEYRAEFDLLFKNRIINQESMLDFLNYFYQKSLTHDLFRIPTRFESFLRTTSSLLYYLIALSFAVVVTPINIQNGYEGFNIASRILTHTMIDHLLTAKKVAAGLFPGLTNGIFYLISTLNCRDTFKDILAGIKREPTILAKILLIFKISLLVLMNLLTASGYATIAAGVTQDKDNIIGFLPYSTFSNMINIFCAVATSFAMLNNIERHLISQQPSTEKTLDFTNKLARNTFPPIAAWRKNHGLFKTAAERKSEIIIPVPTISIEKRSAVFNL